MRQSRRTALAEHPSGQASQETFARARRGGSGACQPWTTQPPAACPPVCAKPSFAWPAPTYAGFNDHHVCEKLCEVEGFSLSRETLRRLLRQAGLGSPRKHRAPTHRQRRLRSAPTPRTRATRRLASRLAPRTRPPTQQDDSTGKILAAQFFPSETAFGYLSLLRQLLRRHGVPLAFYGDRSGIFVRNDNSWSLPEQLAGKRQNTQFGHALDQLGITFIAAQSPQAKGRVERLWVFSKIASPATAPRPSRRSGLRQRCPAKLYRRLQPPLRPSASPNPRRLASGSAKS